MHNFHVTRDPVVAVVTDINLNKLENTPWRKLISVAFTQLIKENKGKYIDKQTLFSYLQNIHKYNLNIAGGAIGELVDVRRREMTERISVSSEL